MDDVVVGVLAVVVGAVFCFRGYLAMRVIVPIWGAFAGFLFGAGLVANFTDDSFLGTVAGWLAGLAVAVVFGALAYLYYEVSVFLAMAAIGFVLGTSVMVALGVTWNWLVVVVGMLAAAALAFAAIVGDLPMVLLTVLTATAGASTIVGGAMLLAGAVDTDELGSPTTTERLDDDWWWYAVFAVLALVGIVAQLRDTARRRATLRETWQEAGGRQLRSP